MPLCVGFKVDCRCHKTHFKRVLIDRWCRFLTGRQSHSGARVPGTIKKIYARLFRGDALQRRTGSRISSVKSFGDLRISVRWNLSIFTSNKVWPRPRKHRRSTRSCSPTDLPPRTLNTSSTRAGHRTSHPSWRTGGVVEETTEAGTGTVVEVVGGVEAEVGEETEAGEGTIVGSRTGTTETETETGTRVMEVGIAQVLQTRTRGTTLIIRDHIMTATDLLFCLSGVVSGILSIQS